MTFGNIAASPCRCQLRPTLMSLGWSLAEPSTQWHADTRPCYRLERAMHPRWGGGGRTGVTWDKREENNSIQYGRKLSGNSCCMSGVFQSSRRMGCCSQRSSSLKTSVSCPIRERPSAASPLNDLVLVRSRSAVAEERATTDVGFDHPIPSVPSVAGRDQQSTPHRCPTLPRIDDLAGL